MNWNPDVSWTLLLRITIHLVAWVVRVATLFCLFWMVIEMPRLSAEVAGVLGFAWYVRGTHQARSRAAKAVQDLEECQADFEKVLNEEVARETESLVAAIAAAERARDGALAEVVKLRKDVQRLDLSGQFVAACIRWANAGKKKTPAKAGTVVIDADYWWRRIEILSGMLWPGVKSADALLAAVTELATKFDMIRWRQVVNSQFGLTLEISNEEAQQPVL